MTKEDLLARRDVLAKLQSRREQLETASCETFLSLPAEYVMQIGNDLIDWRKEAIEIVERAEVGSDDYIAANIFVTVYSLAYTEFVNALLRIVEAE